MNRTPDNSRLPTAEEGAAIHRKVTLILSMVGQDTDTAMTVLLYALAMRAVADNVEPESIIANFAVIHTQIDRNDHANS